MGAVPVVAVTAADTGQVRAGALGAPQEVVVVDRLAGHAVVAVALGLGAEGANHLGVAADAALAAIDVATFQLQCGERAQSVHRLRGLLLEEQRHDFTQAAEADDYQDQHGEQANVLFDNLVFHWCRYPRLAQAVCGSGWRAPSPRLTVMVTL